jgi:formate hydrogenlyase subunit 6/NADH:ubiquinone oxidoreductase subunit I
MAMTVRNITNGIKGTTNIPSTKDKKDGKRYTAEPQARVDICLTCTKPASECKGNCWGNY